MRQSSDLLDQIRAKLFSPVLKQLKKPLRASAFLNSTRWYVLHEVQRLGLPVECGTGPLTKYNRIQLEFPKSHVFDAVSVGKSTPEKIQVKTKHINLW
ncbi:MAG: hypothetical protein ACFFBD_05125 [Candidatus Hodarchaeota archaeon]